MNARQAAKAASKRIEELEHFNRLCSRDIKAYNKVIDHMIAGGSPCEFCDDKGECDKPEKGKGCEEWMLEWNREGEESNDKTDSGSDDGAADPAGGFVLTGRGGDGMGCVSAGVDCEHPVESVREK